MNISQDLFVHAANKIGEKSLDRRVHLCPQAFHLAEFILRTK